MCMKSTHSGMGAHNGGIPFMTTVPPRKFLIPIMHFPFFFFFFFSFLCDATEFPSPGGESTTFGAPHRQITTEREAPQSQ
jgi:hypothetical protein